MIVDNRTCGFQPFHLLYEFTDEDLERIALAVVWWATWVNLWAERLGTAKVDIEHD